MAAEKGRLLEGKRGKGWEWQVLYWHSGRVKRLDVRQPGAARKLKARKE